MVRILLCLAVIMVSLFSGKPILHAQDLTIAVVNCPKTAKAGQDLKSTLRLLVANTGDTVQKAISLEIVLKNSPLCPDKGRPAAYSQKYYDGVLLRQGREFVTLEPGKSRTITPYGANTIPLDTPVGRTYYLCAVLDPENLLKETNKDNNCACCPIKIVGAEVGPVVTRLMEKCLVPGSTLTILGRNFGSISGTVTATSASGMPVNLSVSSWSDTSVVVRIPDDSRLQEGQLYTVTIIRNGESEGIATGRHNIGICPTAQKKATEPETPIFSPPFFYEKQ